MKGFVPYDKMSKKRKREIDRRARRTWNGLNPVTRRPDDPRAYKREAVKRNMDSETRLFCYSCEGNGKVIAFGPFGMRRLR